MNRCVSPPGQKGTFKETRQAEFLQRNSVKEKNLYMPNGENANQYVCDEFSEKTCTGETRIRFLQILIRNLTKQQTNKVLLLVRHLY